MCRYRGTGPFIKRASSPSSTPPSPAAPRAAKLEPWGASLLYTPKIKSVTYAVSLKCHPCGESVPGPALPIIAAERRGGQSRAVVQISVGAIAPGIADGDG